MGRDIDLPCNLQVINKRPAELFRISGPETLGLCFRLSAHPRRHDHLVVMMVAMMVEQSHLNFDRKSNAAGCQPEKRGYVAALPLSVGFLPELVS